MIERSQGTVSWLTSHLYFAVTKGKGTPAKLLGNGPPTTETSMLLKGCRACLCYRVYPQNYIFHDKESEAHLLGVKTHYAKKKKKKIAVLEVPMGHGS